MKTLLFFGLNALASWLINENLEKNVSNYPQQQTIEEKTFVKKTNFYYSESGNIIGLEEK